MERTTTRLDELNELDLTGNEGPRPTTKQVVVLGAGGHGREIADIVRAVEAVNRGVSLLGLVDDGTPDRATLARANLRFLGSPESIDERDVETFIGVGSPSVRREIANRIRTSTLVLRHPSAIVGSGCTFGEASILAQGVIVTTNVTVGRHTHVNVGTSISHDCTIGDFVTISPGVHLTGAVSIGDGTFVGAGATVLPGVRVGRESTIGAGAVVTRDVASGRTVAGVPAREI